MEKIRNWIIRYDFIRFILIKRILLMIENFLLLILDTVIKRWFLIPVLAVQVSLFF